MLDQKDKYWIWQGQKLDIEGKYWSYIGQGHSLDIGWTYCGQSLDIGQSLDKLLRTNIVNQHREVVYKSLLGRPVALLRSHAATKAVHTCS